MKIRCEVNEASYRHACSSPWVFEDVEFSLLPGVYGLFGPNGSGKTTLLQCLAGIKSFTRGSMACTLNGRRLQGKHYLERLGYVSQQFAFYEEMKVEDFLKYAARMKLIPHRWIPGKVAGIMDCFGLGEYGKSRIESLSTGQRRRLSIAQAMLNDPHMLLLDEPLEGLDLEERAFVMEHLHDVAQNCIILMASHILTEIEHWVEQVLFIAGGKVTGPKSPQQWRWSMMNANHGQEIRFPSLEEVYLCHIKQLTGK